MFPDAEDTRLAIADPENAFPTIADAEDAFFRVPNPQESVSPYKGGDDESKGRAGEACVQGTDLEIMHSELLRALSL